jgi:hypothetical protein
LEEGMGHIKKDKRSVIGTTDLTIVGGQPEERRRKRPFKVNIPAGIELVLHKAATDASFRAELSTNREATLDACDIMLTPTERAALGAVGGAVLDAMITNLGVARRKPSAVMRVVAAAAASLAAGTAGVDCGIQAEPPVYADAGVDAKFDVYIQPSDAGVGDVNLPPPQDAEADAADAADAADDASAADAADAADAPQD